MARTFTLTSAQQTFVTTGATGDLQLLETTAPSTVSGSGQLYVKSSDHLLYFKDSSGTESLIETSASGANNALSNLGVTAINAALLFGSDNAVDIGASGATRPRTIYAGTSLDIAGAKLVVSSSGLISKYNNISTVSGGVPSEVATVDLTGQSAAKGTTTLYTPVASGLFKLSIILQLTTVGSVSSILGGTTGVTITYTEPDGSVAQSIKPLLTSQAGAVVIPANGNTANTTATQAQGSCVINAKAGVAIQYAVGYTSVNDTEMLYSIHLKLEAL